jgi:1-deoxy-D-xylulose-5-phosphate synthase
MDKMKPDNSPAANVAAGQTPAAAPKSDILDLIDSPADLQGLSPRDLAALADEIRALIIQTVSRTGGHLASNLGVVELTLALHQVFDFSRDRLLWDVGHQCYPHKIITGRRDRFATLRQAGGLSGFPSPDESDYDVFTTGHAGTAISTASGMALADQIAGLNDRKIVAVVGDGSIVNGLSLEAINNNGLLKRQLLVVLNANAMAIDVTRGAVARLLDRIRQTQAYTDIKAKTEKVLSKLPRGGKMTETLKHIRDGLRTTMHGAQVFEMLGFRYFGPVDGHDIPALLATLRRVAEIPQPVLLHVHTEKGRGCDYAVEDPCRFHSPSAHKVNGGVVEFPASPKPLWTTVFARALLERAQHDERIVAITAAMPDGTGLDVIRDNLPQRYVDVGISESHALGLAAGLARAGLRPVVAIYSTFMQRAFDQVFHELALQKLPVTICMDRAGLVGSDGAVHHGFWDIAALRALPGMVLMAPADENELKSALVLALGLDGPCAIRYPRDEVPDPLPLTDRAPYVLGQACRVRAGDAGTFLALGAMVEHAIAAADILAREHGLETAVYSARFAKPLDEALVAELAVGGKPILTVEDHSAIGGFGSAVLETAAARSLDLTNIKVLGLPDRFIPHANRSRQLLQAGLAPQCLADAMLAAIESKVYGK